MDITRVDTSAHVVVGVGRLSQLVSAHSSSKIENFMDNIIFQYSLFRNVRIDSQIPH